MTMSHVAIEDLSAELSEAITEVLDMLAEASPHAGRRVGVSETSLEVEIDILSTPPTKLTIGSDLMSCLRLADMWQLTSDDEASRLLDAQDAFCEFANLAGGAVKSIFSEESSLGIPTVRILPAESKAHGSADCENHDLIRHAVGNFTAQLREMSA